MVHLPFRRIAPYLVAGFVVLAIGVWTLRSSTDGAGPMAEVALGNEAVASSPEKAADGAILGLETSTPSVSSTVSTVPQTVFVQVAGAVRRPGVYEVPRGSRVFEVLARAGGVAEGGDEQSLTLAAVVADGTRLVVPVKGEKPESVSASGGSPTMWQSPSAGSPPSAGATVSLNNATAADLDTLPGIGPKTAERIVAYRETNGPFASLEDLDEIPGIGPATVERLRGLAEP